MSHSQFHSIDLFILRHAWLNLWDKRMLLAESTRLLSLFNSAPARKLKLRGNANKPAQPKPDDEELFPKMSRNANTDRINDASLRVAIKQFDKPSHAVPFINSQAPRRIHASQQTALKAPSLCASDPIQENGISHRNNIDPEYKIGNSHDLRTSRRTVPSKAQQNKSSHDAKFSVRTSCSCCLLLPKLSQAVGIQPSHVPR